MRLYYFSWKKKTKNRITQVKRAFFVIWTKFGSPGLVVVVVQSLICIASFLSGPHTASWRVKSESKLDATTLLLLLLRAMLISILDFHLTISIKFPKFQNFKNCYFLVSMLQKMFPWAANRCKLCCVCIDCNWAFCSGCAFFVLLFLQVQENVFSSKKIIVVVMFQFVDWSIWFFWCLISLLLSEVFFDWVVLSKKSFFLVGSLQLSFLLLLFWLSFQFLVVVIVVVVKKQSSFVSVVKSASGIIQW